MPTTTQQEHRNTGSREGRREHACPCIYVARSRYLLARWRGAGWFLLGFWRGHDCRGGGRQARAVSPQLHARKKRDTAAAHLRLRALRWVGMTGDKCAERGRRDTNRQGNRKSQSRHKLPTQWLANHEPPGALRIARVGSGHPHSTPTTLAAIAHIA